MSNPPSQEEIDSFCAAAQRGDLAAVRAAILAHGPAIINCKNKLGDNALTWAAWNGHGDIVDLLLEKGASVDDRESNGKTALICAVQMNRREIAALLLERGADPDVKDIRGQTALMLAKESAGRDSIVQLLERWQDKKRVSERKRQEDEKRASTAIETRFKKLKERRPQKSPLRKSPPRP